MSGKPRQKLSEWWHAGVENVFQLLVNTKDIDQNDLIGLVINPQHIKLLKINKVDNQCEIEYLNIIDLPEGLVVHTEIKDTTALARILKENIDRSGLDSKNIAFSIPRSSAIIKTISLDKRLEPDEIESRVWLEANKLFPNLIGDIYLDFAVNGPSPQDPSHNEVLVVACRKEQIKSYLDVMKMAGLNARVVDINYYAYERALYLINKQSPELKTIALLNISFRLIDLLVIHEGNLVYTHELSYDGNSLLNYLNNMQHEKILSDLNDAEQNQVALSGNQMNEVLKNTIGIHLKHAMQFFYSSKPNTRLDRIILSGDAAAAIPSMLNYVKQEVGKEVLLANPFKDMQVKAKVNQDMLERYSPAFMLCCGLALTKIDIHGRS